MNAAEHASEALQGFAESVGVNLVRADDDEHVCDLYGPWPCDVCGLRFVALGTDAG